MAPTIDPEIIEILSSSSSSSDSEDEDFDIFGLGNIKSNNLTYKDHRRSNRIIYKQKQEHDKQVEVEKNKKRKTVGSEVFDIELPEIFETQSARILDINKRYKSINQEIEQEEMNLKREYEKLQQQKSKIIMELNDNGSKGFQKYDTREDSKLIDNLIKQELYGSGIERHFYFLHDVDIIDLGNFEKLPTSLLFLLKRDPQLAYKLVESDFKNFILRSLDTVVNPIHLQSIIDMIQKFAERKEVIFTTKELVDLVDKYGGNTKLINETKLPIKMGQFNNHLKIQLMRLTLIFDCYLLGESVDWDTFFRLFIMVILDHNCNSREYSTICYLMELVWNVIGSRYQYRDFGSALDNQVRSLSTRIYGDDSKDSEQQDKSMSKGDYEIMVQLINKLDLTQSIEKYLLEVKLKKDLSNLYEFSLKVKLLIIKHGPMKESDIKKLRKSRDNILALKDKVYDCLRKVSSPDHKNESNMNREEMVVLINEDYKDLEYLGGILLKKCDYLGGDIFYKDIESDI